jgi:DNA polymerase-1
MNEKKLFLLDAFALIYRAYYAMIRSPRITADGRNTSAIYGFCNTLDEIMRKEKPSHMAVCFDPAGGQTFRHELYPEYKAQRDKQPEDITMSIPWIKDIIEAYGIKVVEVPGYEADDVIGTLSVAAERDGFLTYMMTPDKDYCQLVTDRVYMLRPAIGGKPSEVRTPAEVCEKYNLTSPQKVIDLLALEGDAADNVPGCPGVGEKTAAKLINTYGDIEGIIRNVNDIKGALGGKIAANIEQIRFSKVLVTIKTDVPLDITPDDLQRREPDWRRLRDIFNELEFKSLMSRLRNVETTETPVAPAPPKVAQTDAGADGMGSLFDVMVPEDVAPVAASFDLSTLKIARNADDVAALVAAAASAGDVAISVYAVGDEAMTAELAGVGVCFGSDAHYVPAGLVPELKPLFNNAAVRVISHDVKRDIIILRRRGIELSDNYFDTAVAHYLLKPEMKHDLPDVAMAYIGLRLHDYEMTATERKKPIKGTPEEVAANVAARAQAVLHLQPVLQAALTADGTDALMTDIELPMVRVLAEMEWTGVTIDTHELSDMSQKLTARLSDLEDDCYAMAGGQFNIASPAQVGDVLFDRLKIDPKAKKTKTGAWSTTEEILEKHRRQWPIVDLILQVRGLRKLLATYVDALPRLINRYTGKIHTTYNQTVTATGRLSSTNPNLQNIPIRTDEGREIRRAFVASPGNVIMSADYSQIELRLMADISGDPVMVNAFLSGEDIHRATAAKIYHLPIDEVTDDQRRHAKTANFGIIYGISAFGLSERLGIPRSEAKELIDGYLRTYPRVAEYMKEAVQKARDDGYVTTVKGRKRYLPEINSRNAVVRGYAERNAINAPLQGSAADIIKIAMVNIAREIKARGLHSRMITQVHDELVFDVVPAELDELRALVIDKMQGAYTAKVPLTVSAGVGKNWLEAH